MSHTITIDLLCGECNGNSTHIRPATIGDNTADFTCTTCGEHWQMLFEVTSFDPPHIGTMLTKRVLGVVRGNHFFPKEAIQ